MARCHLCYHSRAERNVPRPQRFGRLGGTSLQGHESERMGFTSELRHPTTWYTKLAIAILALTLFALLAVGAVSGYLVYRMISPARSHSEIDLQNFPGHPDKLNFTVSGEGPRDGWFFPGLKSAPTIVLCPAYESSRGELLTLASALQDQQYNVLAFRFFGARIGGRALHAGIARSRGVAGRHERGRQPRRRGREPVRIVGRESGGIRGTRGSHERPPRSRRCRGISLRSSEGYGRAASQPLRSWIDSLCHQNVADDFWLGQFEIPECAAFEYAISENFRVSPSSISNRLTILCLPLRPPNCSASPRLRTSLSSCNMETTRGMLDDEKRNYENRIVSFFLVNLPPAGESAPGD